MSSGKDDDLKQALRRQFDELAGDLERWRSKNLYYHDLQTARLKFLIPEGKKVLEIGCGLGETLKSLKPSFGLGVDLSPKMVECARQRHAEESHLKFIEADAEIFASDEKFDYIVLCDVVGSLIDIEETFRNLRRFCTCETRVVISYYNFLWEPVLRWAEKLRLKTPQRQSNWLSPQDLYSFLTLAGFETVKTERYHLLPKKIPLLASFVNRYVTALPGFSAFALNFYVVARMLPEEEKGNAYSTTILIPCRNEKGNIENAVKRLPAFGARQEIIFVDGHSTDGTPEEIQRVMKAYPDKDIKFMIQDGKGKGDAVRKGFAAATGDILMILDADLTVPPEDLPKFYRAIATRKGEFINGSRLVYPMESQAMRFLNMLANKFFSLTFTWLLGQRFKDTLCGTKVIFRKDYENLVANRAYFGDFDPFGDFDLIFGAAKLNLRIIEVQIRYRDRTYGTTNISRFQHGWLLLKMCVYAFFKLKAS